jgi:hypothetical protein
MAAILERRLFLLFLDNMATISGFALFRQYGSYFRTAIRAETTSVLK